MLLYNPVKPEQILRTESRIQVRNLLHASHRRTPASSLLGILRQSPQIGITVLHRCDSGTVGRVRRPACCVGSVYSHHSQPYLPVLSLEKLPWSSNVRYGCASPIPSYSRIQGTKAIPSILPNHKLYRIAQSLLRLLEKFKDTMIWSQTSRTYLYVLNSPEQSCTCSKGIKGCAHGVHGRVAILRIYKYIPIRDM